MLVHYPKPNQVVSLIDHLEVVNSFVIFEAYGELHSLAPPLRRYSFGSSRGMPLCHPFLMTLLSQITWMLIVVLRNLGPIAFFAYHDCSRPEEMSSWASLLLTSLHVVPYSLCGKLDRRFTFDYLTSCPDCNPALNCAGSPRCFSSQELQNRK
jgi:hypothetical protein